MNAKIKGGGECKEEREKEIQRGGKDSKKEERRRCKKKVKIVREKRKGNLFSWKWKKKRINKRYTDSK